MTAKTHGRESEHELWFALKQCSQFAANVDEEARSLQADTAANPTSPHKGVPSQDLSEERILKCSIGKTYRWGHTENHFSCLD